MRLWGGRGGDLGEGFAGGGLELGEAGGGLGELVRGGGEWVLRAGVGFGGRRRGGRAGGEGGGELLGFLKIFLSEAGDFIEAGGRDADLLGGGGERAGEGFEGALAVVEGFVLDAFVAGDERDEGDEGAGEDEGGDEKYGLAGKWAGGAGGEEAGGTEERGIGDEEDPEREFSGGRGVGLHGKWRRTGGGWGEGAGRWAGDVVRGGAQMLKAETGSQSLRQASAQSETSKPMRMAPSSVSTTSTQDRRQLRRTL